MKKKNFKLFNLNWTNRPVKGWDSIYRSMVTALISTSPRQVTKSSTEDSALLSLAMYCVARRQQATWPRHLRMPYLHKWAVSSFNLNRMKLIWPPSSKSTNSIVTAARMDSDLEAFSHNPTDGSFVPLIGRLSTWTKCPNLRFLSYWAEFLS